MFKEKRTLLFDPSKIKGQIIRITRDDIREQEAQKEMGVVEEDDVVIGFVTEANATRIEYLHRVRILMDEFLHESEEDEDFVPEDYMYEIATRRGTLLNEDILHEINTDNKVRNVLFKVEVVDVK
ncbi:hypothetical protein M3_0096 [Lysinibacillus phage vB_LfM_LysYB1]|nr:hypothetical protein M3_0096 [Lysinibacillus phage vB_LfM_LysYB1]WAB25395.1 hypothetical protein M5_0217 [Lysinibacillus phage vB_LfM_LysYB2]